MSVTQGKAQQPFVTPKSTIGFSLAYFAGLTLVWLVAGINGGLGEAVGVLAVAAVLVTSLVAWINGMVLAYRAHSVIWFVVAVFVPPPFGSMAVALWCKQP
jgi:hypothetical protein